MSVKSLISSSDQLERAVVISLFTWRRAEKSDQVDDSELYGYWGDAYPDVAKDKIGSRLWLLRRRTISSKTIQDAKRYADEALKWLADDGVAEKITVTVVRVGLERLDLIVTLTLDDEQRQLEFKNILEVINAV